MATKCLKGLQMDQIIELNIQYFNNTKIQTVDAEDLYKFLEVKSKFAD